MGLAIARMIAQVTFRSDNVFTEKFGRGLAETQGAGDGLEVAKVAEFHGGGADAPIRLHASVEGGHLGMDAYAFGPDARALAHDLADVTAAA